MKWVIITFLKITLLSTDYFPGNVFALDDVIESRKDMSSVLGVLTIWGEDRFEAGVRTNQLGTFWKKTDLWSLTGAVSI